MKIELKAGFYNCNVIVEAENVKIEDCITKNIYDKTEEGKIDFKNCLGYDITDEAMSKFTTLLEDITFSFWKYLLYKVTTKTNTADA